MWRRWTNWATRLYDLGVGGTLGPEQLFNAGTRPFLTEPSTTYDQWCCGGAQRSLFATAAATSLHKQLGGLYIGMKDCLRSTMC